jgi:hypothetical protein
MCVFVPSPQTRFLYEGSRYGRQGTPGARSSRFAGGSSRIETASKVDGSLGNSLAFGFKSLLAAVGQLFTRLNNHESKINEHDLQLKIAQGQISNLQMRIHGLKVSKGKVVAAKERALAKAQAPSIARRAPWTASRCIKRGSNPPCPAHCEHRSPICVLRCRLDPNIARTSTTSACLNSF